MIYGEPSITIEDDHTDLIGLRTLLLSQMWQPSSWPLAIDALDKEAPSAPEVPGGLWLIGRQRRRQGGVLREFWLYEGINGDGKTITFKTRGKSPHYGFDPGLSERPIQLHPKIESLLDKYEGQVIDNQIIWPLNLSGTGATSGLQKSDSSDAKINPLFGRDSYLAFQGGTYWYRYMVQDEARIPDIIGKIFRSTELPGGAPRFSRRDWLGSGSPWQRRGPAAVEVVEQYLLSDEGGWPKEIYGSGSGSRGVDGIQPTV